MTHHEGEGAKGETGDDSVEHEYLAISYQDDSEVLEDPARSRSAADHSV